MGNETLLEPTVRNWKVKGRLAGCAEPLIRMSRPSWTLLENRMVLSRTPELSELTVSANPSTRRCCKGNWDTARAVVTREKTRAAILSFEHFKASGVDDIYPAMLKEGIENLEQLLRNIFRGYLALPKPRQISLTLFSLKCLGRLVERHIREKVAPPK